MSFNSGDPDNDPDKDFVGITPLEEIRIALEEILATNGEDEFIGVSDKPGCYTPFYEHAGYSFDVNMLFSWDKKMDPMHRYSNLYLGEDGRDGHMVEYMLQVLDNENDTEIIHEDDLTKKYKLRGEYGLYHVKFIVETAGDEDYDDNNDGEYGKDEDEADEMEEDQRNYYTAS
ncbi:hypothetical protein P171DRAFT_478793 [Karstenula rhodostoma CBS 690.94]|uniref:Uncharacterized protein n=1 Tax=Karstenula rhodostoma CBS 690.94 TaxID=1392251 RepID=A0A9P4PZJ8_9PLEO|nr:hypothetical protein P171DRAFT_478793 [Karstenula rhodostoma CBS 690.94]